MHRVVFVAVVMLSIITIAGVAVAGSVVGSDHDLSAIAGGRQHAGSDFNDYNEVCVYCHTPHGADPAVPLWNRQIFQGNYTIYDSSVSQTFDATPEQPSLTGVSRMCLSCHDGTIAVDALVNEPNTPFAVSSDHMRMSTDTGPDSCNSCHSGIDNGTTINVQPSFVGTDLTDDHPVSFQYNGALLLLDPGLEDPTSSPSGLGGTIKDDMLVNDRVECSSCHNVHDPDIYPFLIKPNINSALCVTCHKK
jgi:predicted CXXCH cytochrome family protein